MTTLVKQMDKVLYLQKGGKEIILLVVSLNQEMILKVMLLEQFSIWQLVMKERIHMAMI